MSLIYRVFIKPEKVYPKPISEWDAIDNLPLCAKDVRWSLLYRKLKGERGCSYLFPQEYMGLVKLLEETNEGTTLKIDPDEEITLDSSTSEIIKSGKKPQPYIAPIRRPINPLIEAAHLIRRGQQFESYLQAYFTLNIDRDPTLAEVCGVSPQLSWFANEVYAGTGMQRIDIFCILLMDREQEFRVIELKTTPASVDDIDQIAKYVRWTKVYIHGASQENVQPVLFARSGLDKNSSASLSSVMRAYDNQHQAKPIKYYEFEVRDRSLLIK